MKKALVLGASGGMGYAIVNELTSRGTAVTAFARTREKLERLFRNQPLVNIVAGDVFRMDDLLEAAADAEVIFQAVNIPYAEWESRLPALMRNVVQTAEKRGAKLAIVDNIYAYGRSTGEEVSETTPKHPHTKKGAIRLRNEQMVKESHAAAVIAHFPDFYGPNAHSTLLYYTLQKILRNKKSGFVGDQTIAREFIFTPDGAKAIVNLAMTDRAYGQNWNIPGCGTITGEALIEAIRNITGYDKPVSTISKGMIQFLGLFNKTMREAVEMYYLNEQPLVLNGAKYEREIGPLPRTSYQEGLKQTLAYMRSNGG